MTLNEITANIIDIDEVWHDLHSNKAGTLNEACGGTIASVNMLSEAVAKGEDRQAINKVAANVIYGALLCAYQAGVDNVDEVVRLRTEKIRAHAYTSKSPTS